MGEQHQNLESGNLRSAAISRSEWRWILIVSAIIVAVTCIPFVVAWIQTPDDWYYTGTLLNPGDANFYLSVMKQGFDGKWLLSNTYTSEPHNPTFLYPFYLLLGHFARLFQLSLGFTFQFFRALNSFILLLVLYFFCTHFWQEPTKRRTAFFFTVFASGFGWFFVFLNIPTSDINIPESVTFLTMMVNPHFPLSTSLIILSLIWAKKTLQDHSLKYAFFFGLGQLFLLYLHPYDIVITGCILGTYFLIGWLIYRQWSWKTSGYLLLGWLICSPGLYHNLSLYTHDGVWKLFQTQNPPKMPPFSVFGLGYGLLLILSILGLFILYFNSGEKKQTDFQMIIIWGFTVFILMFTPIPILEAMQVRFSEGLQIPVIFLAVETLFYFEKKYLRRKNFKLRFWALLLIFFSLSNLLIFTSTFWRIRTPEAPWFYKTNEIEVMRWLGKNSTEDEVVLSLEWSGNHIPTQANIHVYVGQLFATINYHEKRKNAEEFYGEEMTEEEAWCFLYVNGIDWVFIGSQELGTSFLPEQKPFLLKSFSAGESAIYRVIKPPSTLQCNAPTN